MESEERAAKDERHKKIIGEILELKDGPLIRVLGYLVARAEAGDWLASLEQEIARQRTRG